MKRRTCRLPPAPTPALCQSATRARTSGSIRAKSHYCHGKAVQAHSDQNLLNAAVSDSVFSRYNIVSEADVADAAKKIEEGAKVVMHSSFTVVRKEDEISQEGDAREPV